MLLGQSTKRCLRPSIHQIFPQARRADGLGEIAIHAGVQRQRRSSPFMAFARGAPRCADALRFSPRRKADSESGFGAVHLWHLHIHEDRRSSLAFFRSLLDRLATVRSQRDLMTSVLEEAHAEPLIHMIVLSQQGHEGLEGVVSTSLVTGVRL